MLEAWNRCSDRLEADVDGASLGVFRMLVALQVLCDVGVLALSGQLTNRYVDPDFFFKYPFLTFVLPPRGLAPFAFFGAIGLVAVAVLVGWRTRWATRILSVLVLYWFLIDSSNYTDHAYLLCLLCLMLTVLPVNRWMSSDRYMGREKRSTVPYWSVWIVRVQMTLVFLYSGLSQWNADWLAGAPQSEWIALSPNPLATQFAGRLELIRTAAWISMILDLSLAFLLWSGRTRAIGLVLVSAWELVDALWLRTGVSPSLLWGGSLLFCNPEWPRAIVARLSPLLVRVPGASTLWRIACWSGGLVDRALSWFDDTPVFGKAPPAKHDPRKPAPASSPKQSTGFPEAMKYCVAVWLLFQIGFPLRHFLDSGNSDWTDFGSRFSWRGSKHDKQADFAMFVEQPGGEYRWPIEASEIFPVPLALLTQTSEFADKNLGEGALRDLVRGTPSTMTSRIEALGLTQAQASRFVRGFERCSRLCLEPHQYQAMIRQPDLARQYARKVAEILKPLLGESVGVFADMQLSLDNRPFQSIVSDQTNLAIIATDWDLLPRLIPLQEPLPDYAKRLEFAQEQADERQRAIDMALPSTGVKRPPEPSKAPGIDAATEEEFRKKYP